MDKSSAIGLSAPTRQAARPLLAVLQLAPGVCLAGGIAVSCLLARQLSGFGALSPLILAVAFGMLIRGVAGIPVAAKPGVTFSGRRLLRLAIVLLGLQLTFAQVLAVGTQGLFVIGASLTASLLFTTWVGRLMAVDAKLTELIAAGTAICGASAVIATNTVTRASDEDVTYAVACVTLFGTVAMLVYPLLPELLKLDPRAYGLWTGASVHEVAQVVAAAFQGGETAGELGTVAKLARVLFLAPLVLLLGGLAAGSAGLRRAERSGPPVPWFILGFVAVIAVNSTVALPAAVTAIGATATTFLLSTALAALGLDTDVWKLRARGARPLALGLCASVFISGFSLALVKWIG